MFRCAAPQLPVRLEPTCLERVRFGRELLRPAWVPQVKARRHDSAAQARLPAMPVTARRAGGPKAKARFQQQATQHAPELAAPELVAAAAAAFAAMALWALAARELRLPVSVEVTGLVVSELVTRHPAEQPARSGQRAR